MRFVNPDIYKVTLIQSPEWVLKERIRRILCDKYGLEGDCTIDEMINDIFLMIMRLEI